MPLSAARPEAHFFPISQGYPCSLRVEDIITRRGFIESEKQAAAASATAAEFRRDISGAAAATENCLKQPLLWLEEVGSL